MLYKLYVQFQFSCHQDPGLLEGRVNLRQVKAGSVVAHQGDQVGLQGRTDAAQSGPVTVKL